MLEVIGAYRLEEVVTAVEAGTELSGHALVVADPVSPLEDDNEVTRVELQVIGG